MGRGDKPRRTAAVATAGAGEETLLRVLPSTSAAYIALGPADAGSTGAKPCWAKSPSSKSKNPMGRPASPRIPTQVPDHTRKRDHVGHNPNFIHQVLNLSTQALHLSATSLSFFGKRTLQR